MKIVEKMTKLEVDPMKFVMYKDQVGHFERSTQYSEYVSRNSVPVEILK